MEKKKSISGFIGDFLTYGIGNVIASSISIIITPLLTRIFTPYEYGIIDIVQTTTGILAILAALQLESAILRYYNCADNNKELLSIHIFFIIIISLIIIFFGITFLGQINTLVFKGDPQIGSVLSYSLLTVPSTLLIQHVIIIFRTLRKAKYVVIISSAVAIIYFVLTVIFVVFLHSGIKGIFLARFVTEGVISAFVIFLFRRHYARSFSSDLLLKMLKFSLPLIPERVANICLIKANRYFLITYATVTDIGNFNVAQKVPSLIMLAVTGFGQAWFPYAFSIMDREYANEVFSHAFSTYMKSMFFLTVIIMLFSKEIILLLATKEYLGVSGLIGLVGADIVMFGAAQILCIGLLIKEKMQWHITATIISAATNILLNYIFIPDYGITGAALSLYVANFIISISTYYFAKKYYPVPYDIRLLIIYFILIPIISYINSGFLTDIELHQKLAIVLCVFIISNVFLKREISFIRDVIKERVLIKAGNAI